MIIRRRSLKLYIIMIREMQDICYGLTDWFKRVKVSADLVYTYHPIGSGKIAVFHCGFYVSRHEQICTRERSIRRADAVQSLPPWVHRCFQCIQTRLLCVASGNRGGCGSYRLPKSESRRRWAKNDAKDNEKKTKAALHSGLVVVLGVRKMVWCCVEGGSSERIT